MQCIHKKALQSHFHFYFHFQSPSQVNGVDVSQCSHEEAVQRFLEAEEPIMVEVKRRGKAAETTEAKVDENEL